MLYTRKGDDGKTRTFGCDQRISKSSAVAESLGTLDEINSFLGVCKVHEDAKHVSLAGKNFVEILDAIQQNLFIVQAELACADKRISEGAVHDVEEMVDMIEKKLPPITTFFVAGGTEFAALLDVARTTARRAERRVVEVHEDGNVKISDHTLAYLNRLSSLLYAMARFANHKAGVSEDPPRY